jgi:hypothetical protein
MNNSIEAAIRACGACWGASSRTDRGIPVNWCNDYLAFKFGGDLKYGGFMRCSTAL